MRNITLLALVLLATTAYGQTMTKDSVMVHRCQETTTKGIQCKNPCMPGKDYCYVHRPATRDTIPKDTLVGPRGGLYYLKDGKKVYLKKR